MPGDRRMLYGGAPLPPGLERSTLRHLHACATRTLRLVSEPGDHIVIVDVNGKSPSWVTRAKARGVMQRYFDQIDALKEIGEVLEYARCVCLDQGVIRMSYHVTPVFDEPTSATTAVYAHGFSEEWLDCYEQHDFRSADPIPERVMKHGAMMTWQEAMNAAPNTPENEAYFAAMRKYGLVTGVGVPLFGPHCRDAYASFDFGQPIAEVSEGSLGLVRAVAQAAHQRLSLLLDQADTAPALSDREIEVLTWAARGKSLSAIATILGLSPDTVKTYAKRVYAKLDTNDRVGAVVKALKMGLVRI